MIARKYGLHLAFDASAFEVELPFTRKQIAEFETVWEEQVVYMCDWCRRLGNAAGIEIVDDREVMWIALIGVDVQPLDLFITQARRDFDAVNEDFKVESDFDLPLDMSRDPKTVARRIRFWEYVRRRYSELAMLQNRVLRRHVKGRIVGNLEFDTEPDFKLWGQAYDIPGFNFRTALFDNEIGYRYWVGYGVKLAADLTHRAPMISIRTNQVAAGPRMVPSQDTTRHWYNQAIQSGARGFYLWIKDFIGDERDGFGYTGRCMANPDASTRPKERWQTHLELSKMLGERRVFQPPKSEIGILVSIPSCAAGAWLDVFSAHIEATRAGIFSRFISTAELREDTTALGGLRLLLVPKALFEYRAVLRHLREAAAAGLTILIADPTSFSVDENGELNDERGQLTGVASVVERPQAEPIVVDFDHARFRLEPYRSSYSLEPIEPPETRAVYSDGASALIEHVIGRGRVISSGVPLLDIYAAGIRDLRDEKASRYEFLGRLRETSGARDDSWVFDVNCDSLGDVTGMVESRVGATDLGVRFPPFLYVHGVEGER